MKAAVLPVPVWARPNTSRPESTMGMACCWIGVGVGVTGGFDPRINARIEGKLLKTQNVLLDFDEPSRTLSPHWCDSRCRRLARRTRLFAGTSAHYGGNARLWQLRPCVECILRRERDCTCRGRSSPIWSHNQFVDRSRHVMVRICHTPPPSRRGAHIDRQNCRFWTAYRRALLIDSTSSLSEGPKNGPLIRRVGGNSLIFPILSGNQPHPRIRVHYRYLKS